MVFRLYGGVFAAGPTATSNYFYLMEDHDGLVDPGVSGVGEGRPSAFFVHLFPSPWLRITSAVPAVR